MDLRIWLRKYWEFKSETSLKWWKTDNMWSFELLAVKWGWRWEFVYLIYFLFMLKSFSRNKQSLKYRARYVTFCVRKTWTHTRSMKIFIFMESKWNQPFGYHVKLTIHRKCKHTYLQRPSSHVHYICRCQNRAALVCNSKECMT